MKINSAIFSLIGSLLISLLAISVSADTRNVNFRDLRAMGMGGAGLATMTGYNAMIYNPALLAKSDFGLEIINVQVNMSKDIFDIIEFIDDNEELLDNFYDTTAEAQAELLRNMDKFDNNFIGLGVLPKFGVVMKGFAVGVYATSDVGFILDRGIFEPRIIATGHADLVASLGYGQKLPVNTIGFLPNDIYFGGALKIITRYSQTYRTSASDAEFDSVIDSLQESKETGYGIDLGVHYELLPKKLDVGLKIVDLLSRIGDNGAPMLFNIGASYIVNKNLVLAADYNDFFMRRGANVFNRLYFGGEYSAGGVVDLRFGFAQGYPSAGIGIDLNVIAFDWAVYGIEKSNSPGGDGDYNYSGRIKIGW